MLRIKMLMFSLILLMLAGCGPMYKTEFSYVAPKANMGKVCATQCIQNQSMCEQMCQMKNQTCRLQAHQEAIYQYDNYRREQERLGKGIKRTVSDFEYTGNCNEECHCVAVFNGCYSACGGQVIERQVCVAFCDIGKK
ncbi:MAG: hypothetical protein A3F11_06525 [Gammaproteobacteria bacterium RIFCSPHIGHO2_12_FULL_37_14]|nr:MAG: hypothetical protein A3F11_06525 [Gammaproteobacteria bacterium RIFCSPHIGHO2_12_FULL_37_14]